MAYGVKRSRRKRTPQRTPDVRRRALKIIAAHPGGCTEAILAAQNILADVLIELVSSGLVMSRSELLDDEDGAVGTTLWITAAGEWVLAAQGQSLFPLATLLPFFGTMVPTRETGHHHEITGRQAFDSPRRP